MCKFCNKENKNSLEPTYTGVDNVCKLDVYMNQYLDLIIESIEVSEIFEINFCPICGKRLRDDLIEANIFE